MTKIEQCPLILGGPILRKTQAEAVTVWLALKQPCKVTLTVYSTQDQGETIAAPLLQGKSQTLPIGKFLHITVITATSSLNSLQPGHIYAYNLSLDPPQANLTNILSAEETISYFPHGLPTFSLPPDDLDSLQIVHGSCRKVHGGGKDALPILDDLIAQRVTQPNDRPHQLFLTGDQVYADDVPDPFLWAATALGNTLLGWEEDLPINETSEGVESQPVSYFAPGQRTEVAERLGGLTAMLDNKPEKAKSHLFGFGEYCAAYLLVWSSVLFPQDFPPSHAITQNRQHQKTWDKEVEKVKAFSQTLWQVRRALANIPTYTICDDHDVSDDWYLNREWCDRVLSKPLGRRILQNALLAYALFQAWGNTPEQFAPSQPGNTLLDAAQTWSASQGKDHHACQILTDYLGLPPQDPQTGFPKLRPDQDIFVLDRHPQALQWHYSLQMPAYEVLVLDTRTWRGYSLKPEKRLDPPRLLSPTAFAEQIETPLKTTPAKAATLVVLPTNLVSLKIIDLFQERDLAKNKVFNNDVGDSWNLNPTALTQLLQALFQRRDRVIILSGDIHYACAVRLNCWFHNPSGVRPTVLAQLTASGFKNADLKTYIAHTKLKSLIPEPTEHWLGWHNPPRLLKAVPTPHPVIPRPISLPSPHSALYPLHQSAAQNGLPWTLTPPHPPKQHPPDFQYTIEWIPRQRACNANSSKPQPKESQPSKLTQFWCNRWLQEGKEIVGHNNVSIVHFQQSATQLTAIQDVYWWASWDSEPLVYSRYEVPLDLDQELPSQESGEVEN